MYRRMKQQRQSELPALAGLRGDYPGAYTNAISTVIPEVHIYSNILHFVASSRIPTPFF